MVAEMENAEGHDWKIHEEVRSMKWCNGEEMHLEEDVKIFINRMIEGNNLSL